MNTTLQNNRWLALILLCFGHLMIVLDTTIVNVALPSIRVSLGFSETSLVWVVNAYMLTFGGFLLLGGRIGDLFGHRRIFLTGIFIFTLASLLCGVASSPALLVGARALQGIGGAVVSAVALSLMMSLFSSPEDRAKAMGVFGFVAAGGGSIGVFLGGVLTNILSWHWIFLVNLPVGAGVFLACLYFLPRDKPHPNRVNLDIGGAFSITSALMLFVYAVIHGGVSGWLSISTIGCLGSALVLFAVFLLIEKQVKAPLMPLDLFKFRNVSVSNSIGVLWAGAMFAWFFMSALYLQQVLKYDPFQVGMAFLPANIIMGILSIGISAKLVVRYGIRSTLGTGLLLAASGLLWLVRAPINGQFWVDIFPSMVLLGIGAGIAFNPLLLAAMNDVSEDESGIASGLVNTSFMMGGSVGLAILATLATSRSQFLIAHGSSMTDALLGGYHLAFFMGALFAILGAILGITYLRVPKPSQSLK